MGYKKMLVYSGGTKDGKTAKMNLVGYCICFILLCVFHVTTFVCNISDDKNETMTLGNHILHGTFFLVIIGWLTALMLYAAIDSFKNIKKNKLIPLSLYRIEEFAKIGNIPENQFVLFSDENGVVLAFKEFEEESKFFAFGAEYFYEFEKYYNEKAVKRIELSQ